MNTAGHDQISKIHKEFKGAYHTTPTPCDECHTGISIFDEDRVEIVCPACGLVLLSAPSTHGKPTQGTIYHPPNQPLGKKEYYHPRAKDKANQKNKQITRLTTKYEKRDWGNAKKWKRKQYHRYVGVVASWLHLTPLQQDTIHYQLDKIPDMRRITAWNNDHRHVVTSLSIGLIETRSQINFDSEFLKEIGFNKETHKQIHKRVTKVFQDNS